MADNINAGEATAGTLRAIAADEISSTLYQRIKLIHGADGVNAGDVATTNPLPVEFDVRNAYIVQTGNVANAVATVVFFDLFNASGSGLVVKITDLRISELQTAVTGIGLTFDIIRSSTVGTGGTVLTPNKMNTSAGSLPAQITARTKPTGGAATSATLFTVNASSEDLSPYQASGQHINLLPAPMYLQANEGLKVTDTLGSAVGQSNIICTFNVI